MSDRTLIVLPDESAKPILAAINAAKKMLQVKMFVFSDPKLRQAVVAAHQRGVKVRVMLNAARRSGEDDSKEVRKALERAGVEVKDSNPAFGITHEKSMVVDEEIGFVKSLNWATKNLTETRDHAITTVTAGWGARLISWSPTALAFAVGLLCVTPLCLPAQSSGRTETDAEPSERSPGHLTGGGPVAARALANQVNNPTAPVTMVQFREVFVPSVPGYDSPANVLQVEPVFPIFSSCFLPFDQLVKLTIPIPSTPNPRSQTGLGDISLFDVAAIRQSWGEWGLGPALVFPTATSTALGQGKWQAGPAVAAIFTAVPNLQVGVVAQNPISFAGSSSRPAANTLAITPTLTYNLPHGWFTGYSDFDWTFDWENGGAATIPLGVQVGKILKIGKVPVSLSLECAWFPERPAGSPEWLICVELTVIYKTFRGRH